MEDIRKLLHDEVEKLSEPQGIRVIECSMGRGKNGLNIYIVIDKDGGVTIDDCEKISRMLSTRVEVLELLEPENYSLKISSPGINREFKDNREYELFKLKDVKITIQKPFDVEGTATVLKGTLLGMKDEIVTLKRGEDVVAIPLQEIRKCKLDG